ncbi:flagellar basal-body rod protein FlgB [Acidiphilium sp. MT5]
MTSTLLDLSVQKLSYLNSAQRMLSQNLANLDTPGYTPSQPVPFSATINKLNALQLAAPDGRDLPAPNTAASVATTSRVAARAPDGNAVSLDQQLAAMAHVQLNQQYAVNLYKSYLGMFRSALGASL